MPVETHQIEVDTQGNNQVLNITDPIQTALAGGSIRDGTVTVFVIGSTAGISTTEFEPGLVSRDLKVAFESIAPENAEYLHERTWHDDNGHSHVRATLLGPSLTVPMVDGALTLGTWQQIILIDFDTRSRQRRVVVQVVGDD
ncbi:MAG: secondary thiamine-phosphate synthase enzyme YjbQ [Phycisphaerae bacterium]